MSKEFSALFGRFLSMPETLAASMGEIESLCVDREERSLEATVRMNRVVARQELRALERALGEVLELSSISLAPRYDPALFDVGYLSELIGALREQSVPINGFLEGCHAELDNGILTIELKNGGAELMERQNCAARMSAVIREQFGIQVPVQFSGVTRLEENNTVLCQLKKQDAEMMQVKQHAAPTARPFTFDAQGLPFIESSMQMIAGRGIKGKPTPLAEINENTGKTLVWGDIFKIDKKDTRDGVRRIFTFFITDYTGSNSIKVITDLKEKDVERLETLREGETILAQGDASFDKYDKEINIRAFSIARVQKHQREDTAEHKRIELHAHTKMSAMDGLVTAKDLVTAAANFGHSAIAITDHGVVQAFPEAAATAKEMAKAGKPIQIVYGVEGYLVNDMVPAVTGAGLESLDGELIVFDLETTGLSAATERIIEIGAVRLRGGVIVEEFDTFVDPLQRLSLEIVKLTGITDEMLEGAPSEADALDAFYAFCGGDEAVLIAHNARFDTSFLKAAARRCEKEYHFTAVDTLVMARSLYKELKSHKLGTLASHLEIGEFTAHRACDDARALALIFQKMLLRVREQTEQAKTVGDLHAAL
ncbi:MAG: exonuclease domain-containing protein, partial [Oscillospiraceae bacterium]